MSEYDWQDDSKKCYEEAITARRYGVKPKTPVSCLYPIRRGAKIFVLRDGIEIEIHPLEARIISTRWLEAMGGAYVYSQVNDD